ncbi:MAG: DUF6732 family protein [Nereida ignava]|uniref:DUF6732 family protein n=1 Tax=Nereida ignava TaxID=282199 RepID=UPI0030FA5E97
MKHLIAILSVLPLFVAPANAHVGHWADVAGHDHWVAAGALGAAAAAALWGWRKGKKDEAEVEEADAVEPATEEEPA